MAGVGAIHIKADNIKNVRARRDLLIEGIKKPSSVDKAILETLSGQRAFAALNIPKLNITALALNTLKRLANELFTDPDEDGRTGFEYLDALRTRLGQKLSEVAASRTVEAKAERKANRNAKSDEWNASTQATSLKLQKAHFSLYTAFNGLVKHGELESDARERVYRILENHHIAFASLFEPDTGDATGNEPKVTKLRRHDGAK